MDKDPMTPNPYGRTFRASRQRRFRQQVSRMLSPLFSEVLSTETRKLQQQLLVIAFLLLAFSLAFVQMKDPVEIPIAGAATIKVSVQSAVLPAGVLLCLYLEVVAGIRAMLEWSTWRLRAGAAEVDVQLLLKQVEEPSGAQSHIDALENHVEASSLRHLDGPSLAAEELTARQRSLEERKVQRTLQEDDRYYMAAWLRPRFSIFRSAQRARAAIEVFFPAVFGAVAIASGLLAWLK